MARRRSSSPFEEDHDPELDMSPLIDVGFLLLIYFIVATTLLKEEADLRLRLPGTETVSGEPVKVDQMRVRIDERSAVWVNEDLVASDPAERQLATLRDRLDRYAASARLAEAKPFVIIDCSPKAIEQRFVDVLNACTHAGIDNITLSD